MISTIFSGVLFIIFGLFLLIKSLFGIKIPVFRILFGFVAIYCGISLITTTGITIPQKFPHKTIFFDNARINLSTQSSAEKEYNVIVSKAQFVFNLNSSLKEQKHHHIRTIFGATEILIPRDTTAEIHILSLFGSTHTSAITHSFFGKKTIMVGPARVQPQLVIAIDTMFGTCTVNQY